MTIRLQRTLCYIWNGTGIAFHAAATAKVRLEEDAQRVVLEDVVVDVGVAQDCRRLVEYHLRGICRARVLGVQSGGLRAWASDSGSNVLALSVLGSRASAVRSSRV